MLMMRILIAAAILLMHGQPAKALLLWNWSYSGAGFSASGRFTTNDAPDAAGFYQIVGITGTDNEGDDHRPPADGHADPRE
jgi:hypothetical protein